MGSVITVFGFEANSKILNVARTPQVPTYASNTSSGLIYLVWNIVKDCQDTALRRAR
jgi:hypothetical protein